MDGSYLTMPLSGYKSQPELFIQRRNYYTQETQLQKLTELIITRKQDDSVASRLGRMESCSMLCTEALLSFLCSAPMAPPSAQSAGYSLFSKASLDPVTFSVLHCLEATARRVSQELTSCCHLTRYKVGRHSRRVRRASI